MKHIRYILLLTCLAVVFACNKKLDLPSDGRIPLDKVFADYNQTRGYLNSCYGYCPPAYLDRASYSDEAEDADDNNADEPFVAWYGGNVTARNYSTYSADGSPWGMLFQGINKCNVFIENMRTASVLAGEEEKAGWVAQARTLRALYYLQLIKRYGGVPIFDRPLELEHDFSQDSKASFGDVVKFILADCDSALAAPNQNTATTFSWNVYDNQFGIMNRAVVHAIKSQAVTYAASSLWNDGTYTWDDAAQITATALQECLAHDYKLFNVSPPAGTAHNAYALYFLTNPNDQRAVDKETILQIGGARLNVWRDAGLPTTEAVEKAGPCPTQDLVDSYEMTNGEAPITGYSDANRTQPIINVASGYDENDPYADRDPRFYASVYYNGALRFLDQPGGDRVETFVGGDEGISQTNRRNTRTGYYMRKYNDFRSNLNNQADGYIRLFRLAELYLNFAEAAYQAVGPDVPVTVNGVSMTAREAVNAVRARAGMPDFPAGMDAEAFENKYRNERRVELAFEEHRFFDVRRWNTLEQTDKFVTGMRITESGGDLTYTRFKFTNRDAWSDKWLMYPINQDEVIKIIGLSGQNWQNPGWLD